MRVLLINECDSANVGDRAIAEGACRAFSAEAQVSFVSLEKCRYYSDFTALSEAWTEQRQLVQPTHRARPLFLRVAFLPVWICRQLIRISRASRYAVRADRVVIGGGGILMNNNYHFAVTLWAWAFFLSQLGIRFSVAGVSTSGKLDAICRGLFGFCLRRAESVHVRDHLSCRRLSSEFRVTADICPDFAFGLAVRPTEKRDDGLIGLNVTSITHNFTDESYRRYISEIVDFASKCGASRVRLFTTGEPSDQQALLKVVSRLRQQVSATVEVGATPRSPAELIEIVKNCRYVVCSRMHSAVLTLVAGGVPVVLGIDQKSAGLMSCLGLKHVILPFQDAVDLAARISEKARELGDSSVTQDVVSSQRTRLAKFMSASKHG